MQERTLAPRLVQFGQDQLYWECKRLQACGSAPSGLQISRHRFINTRILTVLDNTVEMLGPVDASLATPTKQINATKVVQLSWIQCVTNYSLCQISREKDVLIAMSGIAKAFSDTFRWRAPSWSWASIKGAVTWEDSFRLNYHHLHMIKLMEDYVEPVGSDSTGELFDAWIKLKAIIFPVVWISRALTII